jgi:hypothetical protein
MMETTRRTANRTVARPWDLEVVLAVVVAGLAIAAVTVATQHYNPAPLDPEAGWYLCP